MYCRFVPVVGTVTGVGAALPSGPTAMIQPAVVTGRSTSSLTWNVSVRCELFRATEGNSMTLPGLVNDVENTIGGVISEP